jgi:hypothetical protein
MYNSNEDDECGYRGFTYARFCPDQIGIKRRGMGTGGVRERASESIREEMTFFTSQDFGIGNWPI